MRAIGDVKDTFVKVNGVWYERHIIEKGVLGTENYRVATCWEAPDKPRADSFNTAYFGIIIPYTALNTNFLSNRFIYTGENYWDTDKEGLQLTTTDNRFRMRIAKNKLDGYNNGLTNAQKCMLLSDYLNNNPTEVFYNRIEPLDLPCTQAQITALEALQKARTYKNVTHIFSEDEVPAEVNLIYYLDNEIVYKNILTNYVKNTDYAKGDVGGLIKTGNGFSATSNGYLTTSSYTYPEYTTRTNAIFIGKGTLETIISSSILKTGSTAPTTSTVGYRVGQLYLNTADNKLYQLTSIDNTDPNNLIYNWQQIINNTDLANTVGQINSVLDSINGVEV